MTTAAEYIAGWEGYSGVAYWDVNHWRIGFGSDTEGPERINVTQGMTTTKPRATQNLALRIPEFQAIASRAMGSDVWTQLTANQKIAITSLVYNYGRLPIKVTIADPEKTAASIAARQFDNDSVNQRRRLGEAAFFLTGDKKPTSKPVVVGTALTGGAATVFAIFTWYMHLGGLDRILVSLVFVQLLIILFLASELLSKKTAVTIMPMPPPTPDFATNLKSVIAERATVAANLASIDEKIMLAKQELKKTLDDLQELIK